MEYKLSLLVSYIILIKLHRLSQKKDKKRLAAFEASVKLYEFGAACVQSSSVSTFSQQNVMVVTITGYRGALNDKVNTVFALAQCHSFTSLKNVFICVRVEKVQGTSSNYILYHCKYFLVEMSI